MLIELKLSKFQERNLSLNQLFKNTINKTMFIIFKIPFLKKYLLLEQFLFPLLMLRKSQLLEKFQYLFQTRNQFPTLNMLMKLTLKLSDTKRLLNKKKRKTKSELKMNFLKRRLLQQDQFLYMIKTLLWILPKYKKSEI